MAEEREGSVWSSEFRKVTDEGKGQSVCRRTKVRNKSSGKVTSVETFTIIFDIWMMRGVIKKGRGYKIKRGVIRDKRPYVCRIH